MKRVARESGVARNQAILLELSKLETQDEQLSALKKLSNEGALTRGRRTVRSAPAKSPRKADGAQGLSDQDGPPLEAAAEAEGDGPPVSAQAASQSPVSADLLPRNDLVIPPGLDRRDVDKAYDQLVNLWSESDFSKHFSLAPLGAQRRFLSEMLQAIVLPAT